MWNNLFARPSYLGGLVHSIRPTLNGSRIIPRPKVLTTTGRCFGITPSILQKSAKHRDGIFCQNYFTCIFSNQRGQLDSHQYFSTSSCDTEHGSTNISPNTDTSDEIKIPGAEKGGRKLALIFTCIHCNTRSAKQFTERSYKHGVVIATCPGCKRKHLIADNLGFFAEEEDGSWNIEKGIAKLGGNVRVATNDDVFELSVEDIFTKDVIDAAVKNASNESTTSATDEDSLKGS